MSDSQKLLILGGLCLAAIGMIYGLYYALLVEHQTLDRMGGALTNAFITAADKNLPDSNAALESYTKSKYIYVRQVDVHSHWIGLGMLLIALGASWERLAFSRRARLWLAATLLAGAFTFPLGVFLQTSMSGPLPSAIAIVGAMLITANLALAIIGFARHSAT